MIETSCAETIATRIPCAAGSFSLINSMRVERGDKSDWDALHALHYKAENLPIAPRYWRCVTEEGDLVGIIVTSSVALLSAPRHVLFPKLKPGGDTHFTNVRRGQFLNANFRRAARIVTDTLYRGVGVSYRMVNLAMRLEQFRFVEIQSSMSKYNPFDLKAGFRHAPLKSAAAYDKGMIFFRRYFEAHPADHQAVMIELNAMPPEIRAHVCSEIKRFYYRHSAKEKTGTNLGVGNRKVEMAEVGAVLKELQQLVFATPVYGIWENPDFGREMPESLPLSAFDLQPTDKPLRLDLL